MSNASRTITRFDQQQQQENARLDSMGTVIHTKADVKSIDSSIKIRLVEGKGKLKDSLSSMNTKADLVKSKLTSKRDFRKSYKTEIYPLLIELDTFNNRYSRRDHVYNMMEDAINIANYNLFNLAAFFDAGVYQIPPNAAGKVAMLFGPVIDSITRFSNKYNDVPHTASIVLLGYADAQAIGDSTALYSTLAGMLHKTSPERGEMNKQLSQLRAQELLRELKFLIVQKAGGFKSYNQLRLSYVAMGRGEELPLPHITDYHEDDERRRIVLCYWTVLPNL